MPLSYTPRKMILDPTTKHVITIESEHRTMSSSVKAERLAEHVWLFSRLVHPDQCEDFKYSDFGIPFSVNHDI